MFSLESSALVQAIGWSLVHFLWQGALIATIVGGSISLCSTRRSNLRYAISSLGLLLMLLCPIATTFVLYQPESLTVNSASLDLKNENIEPENIIASNSPVPTTTVGSRLTSSPHHSTTSPSHSSAVGLDSQAGPTEAAGIFETWVKQIEPILPSLIVAWVIGVLFLATRLFIGWTSVERLRNAGRAVTDPQVQSVLCGLQKKFEMRIAVPIRESISIHSPMVIGWLKPVILMPASAITQLSPKELEAILAHELAHIRRSDYLVNLFQSAIEVLLFYHPAVWWISAQIRKERENCCDDLAVSICQDESLYVKALLQLEETRNAHHRLAMSVQGGSMVQRIGRILGQKNQRSKRSSWIAAVIPALMLAFIFSLASSKTGTVKASSPSGQASESLKQDDEKKSERRELNVKVVDPNGTPVAGAAITLGVWFQKTATTERFVTDENGIAAIMLPEDLRIVRLWARSEGYAPLFANWEEEEIRGIGKLPPKNFTFKMIQSTRIAGTVVDKLGRPIPNVAVEVKRDTRIEETQERIRFGTWLAEGADAIMTDENGIWILENIPPGDDIRLRLRFTHPDYIGDEGWGELQTEQNVGLKELRNESAKIVLSKGIKIRGRITDPEGEPVSDGLVIWGDRPYLQQGSQEVYIAEDGTYELPGQKPSELRVTVVAPDFAPQTTVVDVESQMEPVDFQLEAGNKLTIKFVDEKGEPVNDVYVGIDNWRGSECLYNHQHPNVKSTRIPIRCDGLGIYTWDWAPEDAVSYRIESPSTRKRLRREFAPSDEPHVIVMKRPTGVRGQVTDINGKPIPKFRVVPRFHVNEQITNERRREAIDGKDGEFQIQITGQEGKYSLKIEAEGFESTTTKQFDRDEAIPPFRLQLKKATYQSLNVVNSQGEPVTDAIVVSAPADQVLSLRGYSLSRDNPSGGPNTHGLSQTYLANESGSVQLASSSTPRSLLAFSKEGYGEVAIAPDTMVKQIEIKNWASLSTSVSRNGGEPWNARMSYRPIRLHNNKSFHIQVYAPGTPTGNSTSQIEKIPAMPGSVVLFGSDAPLGQRYNLAINPTPGEDLKIDFSNAHNVAGTLRFVGNNSHKIDYRKSKFTLRSVKPTIELVEEIQQDLRENNFGPTEFDKIIEYYTATNNIHANQSYRQCFDSYSGNLDASGDFAVDILRPGKYELTVEALAKTESKYWGNSMTTHTQIIEVREKSVQLGELNVPLLEDPAANSEVADFEFKLLGSDKSSSLQELRGSYVLLDFWRPYCDFCQKETPKIQRLASILARKGKTKIVSLQSSGSGNVVRMPEVIPDGLVWLNGQVPIVNENQVWRDLGVWTTQHLVLIDPNGRFVAGGSFVEIAKLLDDLDLK